MTKPPANIGRSFKQKVLIATMNVFNSLAAALGVAITSLAFYFHQKLQLPQGLDDMEHMMFSAIASMFFGLIIAFATLSGAYWLNKGSPQYKIAFCGLIAVIAYILITIRNVLPQIEQTMNDDMMAEYENYYQDSVSRKIVDICQTTYECCGYFGIEDIPEHRSVPESCCSSATVKKFGYCSRETAFMEPCRSKIGEVIDVYVDGMSTLCIVTSVTLIGLVFAIILTILTSPQVVLRKNPWKST